MGHVGLWPSPAKPIAEVIEHEIDVPIKGVGHDGGRLTHTQLPATGAEDSRPAVELRIIPIPRYCESSLSCSSRGRCGPSPRWQRWDRDGSARSWAVPSAMIKSDQALRTDYSSASTDDRVRTAMIEATRRRI